MAGAHGFHAHLFQRVKHFFRFTPRRDAGGMERFIMMAKLKCRRVRRTAQLGHFIGG